MNTLRTLINCNKSRFFFYNFRLATEAGSFAVNAVDNLVVVHYQELQVSMLFDVRLPGDTDGFITYLNPLLLPAGIGKAPHIFDPLTGKSRVTADSLYFILLFTNRDSNPLLVVMHQAVAY